MLEVPGNFAAFDDSGHDCHVAVAPFAFGYVDLEYQGQAFCSNWMMDRLRPSDHKRIDEVKNTGVIKVHCKI
jgi:hypothetical protein